LRSPEGNTTLRTNEASSSRLLEEMADKRAARVLREKGGNQNREERIPGSGAKSKMSSMKGIPIQVAFAKEKR